MNLVEAYTVLYQKNNRSVVSLSAVSHAGLSKGVTCERQTDELHKKSFSTETFNPAPRHHRAIVPSSSVTTVYKLLISFSNL